MFIVVCLQPKYGRHNDVLCKSYVIVLERDVFILHIYIMHVSEKAKAITGFFSFF